MGEIIGNWLQMFAFWLVVAVAFTPGELIARGTKHSIGSRIRGTIYWAIFLLGTALASWLAQLGFRHLGVSPVLTLDLSGVGESWAPLLRIAVASIMALVPAFMIDFVYYWFHRLQHATSFLWRFHAVHHSIEEMNAINCSHHWTEGFLRVLFITTPLTLLIGLRLPEIAFVATIIASWGQFVHADSRIDFGRLRWLFVSPVFHRVHHSTEIRHFDKNFAGIFPVFDMMFGTAVFARPNEAITTGLRDKHEPRTLGEYLLALRDK